MNRLKMLRRRSGLTQNELAEKLGISRSAVGMWETGKSRPTGEVLINVSRLFDVSTDYILGADNLERPNSGSGVRIPILGQVSAGIPLDAIEDIEGYEEIEERMAKGGEFFALRIRGNSMEPRIRRGDVVIVRKQDSAESGDIIVALVGEEAAVKKMMVHGMGISLVSTNPDYEPMFFSNEQIADLPVRILGKVVELRAKF